jgi:drug/metabolite transporter (DMT)-like permease
MSSTIVPQSTERVAAPTRRMEPRLWLVLTAFAAVYVIWGSTYFAIHLAIESIPPFLMAGTRFLAAGLLLYAVMRARGEARPEPVHWRDATIIGGLLLLVGNGGVSWAQQTVPSGVAALMVGATPLWINLIEWVRPGGQRPQAAVFGGIALGFLGVLLLVSSKDQLGNSVVDPWGGAVLLIAPLCWGAGSVFSRHARQPAAALLAIAMQMIAGGVLLLVAAAITGEFRDFNPAHVTLSSTLAFVYLTLIGSLVGFTAYVWLLQVSTPARVSTYAFVNPFIAVLLGWLFLREPISSGVITAGGLIIAAVALITTTRSAKRPQSP